MELEPGVAGVYSSQDIGRQDRKLGWWLIGAALFCGCATVIAIVMWDRDRVGGPDIEGLSPAQVESPEPFSEAAEIFEEARAEQPTLASIAPVADLPPRPDPPKPQEARIVESAPAPEIKEELLSEEAFVEPELQLVPEPEPASPWAEQSEEIPPENAPPDEAPFSRATKVFLELAERAPDQSGLIGFLSRHRSGPSPDERRRGVERLNCKVVCTCVSTAERWEVTITNLGVGGLEMMHPESLALNTRLAVVPHHYNQTVTGRVVWSRSVEDQTNLGLAFDLDEETLSQSWVASLLLEQGAEFLLRRAPRKYVRVPTAIQSLLVREDGKTIAITLRDVSLGGCLVHSEAEFEVEELTLMLGTVACRGMIIKARKNPRGWSYHIRFKPLGFLEKNRLRRTITLLLKAGS